MSREAIEKIQSRLGWLPPGAIAWLEKRLRAIPSFRERLESEYPTLLADFEASLKPYRGKFARYERLPPTPRPREDILADLQALKAAEEARWKEGYVSGAVYHGDEGHIDFLNQVYALHSQSNPLHMEIWPSAAKFEAEIVAMTAHMLGAEQSGAEICGTVTSGGSESILLAMKAYRDWGRSEKGIRKPEVVAPVTAHAAFEKAANYFGLKWITIPVDAGFRADLKAARKAISRNTVALVGSAPSFPHGAIDPIAELSELARQGGIGFHTDACLGGFILPWAERLGYSIPPFDFRLPGVTSLSVDTHKFGYAAKGASVVLYRDETLRRYQYFAAVDWPGGLYATPTLAGSRPGALSAVCWAALLSLGEEGYLEAARQIMSTAEFIRQAIEAIPELYLLGDPTFVIAFSSHNLDVYRLLDAMTQRGWSLNGLHKPAALHLCVTLRHAQPGVKERFTADLQASIAQVRSQPPVEGGMAPIYGLANTFPLRGVVSDLLKRALDMLYRV